MKATDSIWLLLLACQWLAHTARAQPATDPSALYARHCASCHGPDRLGGMGPPLLPQTLGVLTPAQAMTVVRQGRFATQMPGFAALLTDDSLRQLVQWIYQSSNDMPGWSDAEINASRIDIAGAARLPSQPQWSADPMNLVLVVEAGDHHVSIIDGEHLTVMHRFPSRYALHGGPKFSPDGRYAYFGSRDGWITKYDLWNFAVVAEVRAGLNLRNIATSADGHWIMAANAWPHTAVLFDSDLRLVRRYSIQTLDGKSSSRASAVYDAAPRRSFLLALRDIAQLWEISYDRQATPIYDGMVHDYKMGEALAQPGFLGVRRIPLEEPLDNFFFDQQYRNAIGTTRASVATEPQAQVVNLDARQRIASFAFPGMPHLASGITFPWNGTTVLASPNLKTGMVTIVDMKSWQVIKSIATPGTGFFLRSHENSTYAWVNSTQGSDAHDTLTVIDKRSLEVTASVREPGRKLSHIEFTRDGRYAMVSLAEMDGALIVYDAITLQEVKRLPMCKPVAHYNLGDKIGRSECTSH
ncbi:MAG: cytochrome D1 domain-containing protein [Rhodoferax sp.]